MKREYRKNTLKYRILILLIFSAFLLDFFICIVCGYTYTKNMKDEYNRIGGGIVHTVADSISEADIKLWLAGEKSSEYEALKAKLEIIKKSALDVEILQVYSMNQDDMTVIFDAANRTKGERVAYPKSFDEIKTKLRAGEKVGTLFIKEPAQIINFAPVRHKDTPAYAIAKINMSGMLEARNIFVERIFLIIALTSVILIVISNLYMNHILIVPLNKIDEKLRRFAEDNSTGDEIKEGLNKIKHHNIKEIDEIKNDFLILCDDVGIKNNEIKELDKKIMDEMQVVLKEYEDE